MHWISAIYIYFLLFFFFSISIFLFFLFFSVFFFLNEQCGTVQDVRIGFKLEGGGELFKESFRKLFCLE